MYTVKFNFWDGAKQLMKDVLEDALENPRYYGDETFENIQQFRKWEENDVQCNSMKLIQNMVEALRSFDFEAQLSIVDENVFEIDVDAI